MNVVNRLFAICLTLLGCVLCLSLAVSLLSHIWGWLLGICLVVGAVVVAARVAAARRRRW